MNFSRNMGSHVCEKSIVHGNHEKYMFYIIFSLQNQLSSKRHARCDISNYLHFCTLQHIMIIHMMFICMLQSLYWGCPLYDCHSATRNPVIQLTLSHLKKEAFLRICSRTIFHVSTLLNCFPWDRLFAQAGEIMWFCTPARFGFICLVSAMVHWLDRLYGSHWFHWFHGCSGIHLERKWLKCFKQIQNVDKSQMHQMRSTHIQTKHHNLSCM